MTSSYTKENLLNNEHIIYSGHRHWIVLSTSLLWIFIGSGSFLYFNFFKNLDFKIYIVVFSYMLILGIYKFAYAFIDYKFTELVVTDLRVLVKVGWIGRYSRETTLKNIASVKVYQDIWGRLFNYGSVSVSDTGSVSYSFAFIADPILFRKAILNQIEMHADKPSKVEVVSISRGEIL